MQSRFLAATFKLRSGCRNLCTRTVRRRDLYVFTSSRKHFISSHSLPTVFIRANPQPPPADQEIPSGLPSTATISISSSIFSSSSSSCSDYYYPDLVYTQHRAEVCRRPCVRTESRSSGHFWSCVAYRNHSDVGYLRKYSVDLCRSMYLCKYSVYLCKYSELILSCSCAVCERDLEIQVAGTSFLFKFLFLCKWS